MSTGKTQLKLISGWGGGRRPVCPDLVPHEDRDEVPEVQVVEEVGELVLDLDLAGLGLVYVHGDLHLLDTGLLHCSDDVKDAENEENPHVRHACASSRAGFSREGACPR